MSETAAQLLERIRALPDADRRELSLEFMDSQPVHEDDLIAESENDETFQAMLADRIAAVEAHPERLIDGAEAFRRIRQQLAERRGETAE